MVISDAGIEQLLFLGDLRIEPVERSARGQISFGITSGGYDVRLASKFRIFTNARNAIVDPKAFDPNNFVEHYGDFCIIPPNSFMLGMSVERVRIPRDVIGVCLGKSTYARCGIIVCCTPLEPEWEGHITIEVSNTTPNPAKVYAGEGIMQVLFLQLTSPCLRSYADKGGKYQGQTDITLPKV